MEIAGNPSSTEGLSRMKHERRKKERFQADEQTFVVVRPDFTRLGKLIDISEQGLAFQHMASRAQEKASVELDIFKGGNALYLAKVMGEIVYDCQEETLFCYEHRRCGVRFGKLTDEQAAWLNAYIRKFTGAPTKSKGKKS